MFINRIGNGLDKQQVFKGYQHEIDEVGQPVLRFNYPHDYNNVSCKVRFYNVKENPRVQYGYEVIGDHLLGEYPITKNGVQIPLDDMQKLNSKGVYAYSIVKNKDEFADVGININNNYNLMTGKGTTPMVQGAGILSMPDLHRPGASYDQKTGKVIYDINKQKEAEKIISNFAIHKGGNLAGYEYELDDLDNPNGKHLLKDIKVFFSTPIVGGDNVSPFRYWNKNNSQIDLGMGTEENYNSFIKKLFKHGKKLVYDGTFTSEGLEGAHFQYAVKWANKNPQTYRWFRMSNIKDEPLGYGVLPKYTENIRFKPINPPAIIDPKSGKVVSNPNYKANKEVFVQLYDKSLATQEQANDLEHPIDIYKNPNANSPIDINSHDRTTPIYAFEVNPKEYIERLKALVEYNKNNENPIKIDSAEGAAFICQFSNFKFIKKMEGGFVTWDANTDLPKLNYHMNIYDEKILKAIVDPDQREYEEKMLKIANCEVTDLTYQAARRWVRQSRKVQELYTAQTLKNASSAAAIDELIAKGELPKEAHLSEEAVQNILDDMYDLKVKPKMDKDDITIKALMDFTLDSLEFDDNTAAVLSTSFFSNRATNPKTIGLTRFELRELGEPHLIEVYAENYMKTNAFFINELKDFTNSIIQKVNETSSEKLLDENGQYTEYGRYVIDLIGQDIAKYGFLKAVAKDNLDAWTWNDGTITYDYKKIKDNTSLKALGINANNPIDEATELRKVIANGLQKLNSNDVNFVAESISKKIEGTNTRSFKFAEAIVRKASLGLDIRLDAAKDIIDWDAVRNGDMTFDQAWDQAIEFWAGFVQSIKKENPNAYIVAELTDVDAMMQATLGDGVEVYNNYIDIGNKYKNINDAMAQFFLKTGITSAASYDNTFTDLLKVFAPDFEKAGTNNMTNVMNNFYGLLRTKSIDYIRNLWTFADNHDKPSIIHGMALNMGLFLADFNNSEYARNVLMRSLTGAKNDAFLPIEVKYFKHKTSNYYRLASSKAAAMSEAMRLRIETLNISEEQKDLLFRAIAHLTNGCYLGKGNEFKLAFHDTEELATVEGALKFLLNDANINLPKEKFDEIIDKTNQKIDTNLQESRANEIEKRIKILLSGASGDINRSSENDISKSSPYTAAIANAIREAFHEALPNIDIETSKKFWEAERNYLLKYDNAFIENKFNQLPVQENSDITARKDGFAVKDFETVIKMIINEAEYIANKEELDNEKHFDNRDDILSQLFRKTTEPAVKKAVMYASFLSALPGIPTTFARDMLGALGYEERAKNIHLQDRNAIVWSQLEEGPLKEYRTEILEWFKDAIHLRTLAGDALEKGTPYEARTSNDGIPAIMSQDAYGNATVSVFNALNLTKDYKEEPHIQDQYLDYIELGFGLALPAGCIFKNVLDGDGAEYIIKHVGDKVRIFNKNGGQIALNNVTAKHGAMVLKHIAHRGRPKTKTLNKQYNFVSNPYKKTEEPIEGQNLSLIAR